MKTRKMRWILVSASLLGLALIASLKYKQRGESSHTTSLENRQSPDQGPLEAVDSEKRKGGDGISASDSPSPQKVRADEVALSSVTKPVNRNKATSSHKRLSVIDPMASWSEAPAWPEGPRLYAEVQTDGKKYVNLRPNDMGLLPQLTVNPKENLEVTLQMPEATSGERVHVELPNGGRFPDQEATGRTFIVDQNRSVRFTMEADETMGNCTLHIRQAGHTRTLPLWIGEPPILATGDDDS